MSTKIKPKSLQIVYWNANGLLGKLDELVEFALRLAPDVMLVQETHLRANKSVKIPNYTGYRTDRALGRGGGTAAFVKNQIDHFPVNATVHNNIEVTTVV